MSMGTTQVIPQSDQALLEAQSAAGPAGVAAYEAAKARIKEDAANLTNTAVQAAQARGGPTLAMQEAMKPSQEITNDRLQSLELAQAESAAAGARRDARNSAYAGAVQETRGLIKDQTAQAVAPLRAQSDYQLAALRQSGDNDVRTLGRQMDVERARFEAEARARAQQAAIEAERFNRQLAAAARSRAGSSGSGGGAKMSAADLKQLVSSSGIGALTSAYQEAAAALPDFTELQKAIQDEVGARFYEGQQGGFDLGGGIPSTEAFDVMNANAGVDMGNLPNTPKAPNYLLMLKDNPNLTEAQFWDARNEWERKYGNTGAKGLSQYIRQQADQYGARAEDSNPFGEGRLSEEGFNTLADRRQSLLLPALQAAGLIDSPFSPIYGAVDQASGLAIRPGVDGGSNLGQAFGLEGPGVLPDQKVWAEGSEYAQWQEERPFEGDDRRYLPGTAPRMLSGGINSDEKAAEILQTRAAMQTGKDQRFIERNMAQPEGPAAAMQAAYEVGATDIYNQWTDAGYSIDPASLKAALLDAQEKAPAAGMDLLPGGGEGAFADAQAGFVENYQQTRFPEGPSEADVRAATNFDQSQMDREEAQAAEQINTDFVSTFGFNAQDLGYDNPLDLLQVMDAGGGPEQYRADVYELRDGIVDQVGDYPGNAAAIDKAMEDLGLSPNPSNPYEQIVQRMVRRLLLQANDYTMQERAQIEAQFGGS